MARVSPNPRKYVQFDSMIASLLGVSQPRLNHLYSNEYSAYKTLMNTRLIRVPTTGTGIDEITVACHGRAMVSNKNFEVTGELTWTKKRLWINSENNVSTMTLTIFCILNPRWFSGKHAEAMSWNQIAFTTLDRKKNGRIQRAPNVTVNIGSNQLQTKDGEESKCTRYLSEGINP